MSGRVERVLIVGGGTAGWITAGRLAAKRGANGAPALKVTVLESPDVPIIGVGEGTWPTLRATLRKIGVPERALMAACDGSFKQGSKFVSWHRGEGEHYYHPFDPPAGFEAGAGLDVWAAATDASYSEAVCPQEAVCERGLAPKLPTSPDYAGITNYGYHLDAGGFSEFLKRYCVDQLGVALVRDHMTGALRAEAGDIEAVETRGSGPIEADLFVDCTGFRALLLHGEFGVGTVRLDQFLFADSALAVQAPYAPGGSVQSATVATAQPAGWIWDVSLKSRRGIGHVYSSAHTSDAEAEDRLRAYLGLPDAVLQDLAIRKLTFKAGHRERFWAGNCVAIGLSAGFVEPLEASAIMLAESAADRLVDALPMTRDAMPNAAEAFNHALTARWDRIVHFLKLHYALSQRDEPFWRDHRSSAHMPEPLMADIAHWAERSPTPDGFTGIDPVFPAASYAYVVHGMGHGLRPAAAPNADGAAAVAREAARLSALLPANAALLSAYSQAAA